MNLLGISEPLSPKSELLHKDGETGFLRQMGLEKGYVLLCSSELHAPLRGSMSGSGTSFQRPGPDSWSAYINLVHRSQQQDFQRARTVELGFGFFSKSNS